TIGYRFNFEITEDNAAANGHLTFTETRFSGGTVELDLQPSATLKRMNTRAFYATETLSKLDGADCSPEATQTRWAYPITGATGMAEVVRSYIQLQLLTGLKGLSEPVVDPTLPPTLHKNVFSDHLTYTTHITAGAAPTLQLNAGVGSFTLTNA